MCSAGVGNSSDQSLILSTGLQLSGSLKLPSSEAAQCSTAVSSTVHGFKVERNGTEYYMRA